MDFANGLLALGGSVTNRAIPSSKQIIYAYVFHYEFYSAINAILFSKFVFLY